MSVMSAREAAEYCGVCERSVRNWIRDGHLPAIKVGRNFQIRPTDLEPFRRSANVTPLREAMDPTQELACLQEIVGVLELLPPTAQGRIARFVADRYDGGMR